MLLQKHIKSIIFTTIVAMSLYLISAVYLGWEQSITLIQRISFIGWLSLIACSFTSYIIRYGRWVYFIKQLGHFIPHNHHLLYYVSGFALTITPAKVGETIRSLYLFKHGVSYSKSIATFFIERLLDLTVVTFLSSLLLFQHNDYYILITSLYCLILILIYLLKTNYIQNITKYFNKKIKTGKINHFIKSLNNFFQHSKSLLSYRSLVIGAITGILAWSIQSTAFYILLTELDFIVPIYIAISIYSIALLAGAISFIPGGIGSTEIVMGIFLYYYGAPKEIVILAPITIRMTSLWFAVLIGLLSTIIVTKNINKTVY